MTCARIPSWGISALTALALALAGCPFLGPDPGPSPCDLDRLGCEGDPTNFPYLDDCPGVSGPLEVAIGHGERSYRALAAGAGPEIHFGPQGGQHVFLGFRVDNAALELYDRLRVTYWVAQGERCEAGQPLAKIPDACDEGLGIRQMVVGGSGFELRLDGDGAVEEYGALVFVEYPRLGARTVVTAEVEDPCGRVGVASHTYTLASF